MKSNIFTKIVDETVVEVETGWQDTVNRLREQCHNIYSVYCTRSGKITASQPNGKTKPPEIWKNLWSTTLCCKGTDNVI